MDARDVTLITQFNAKLLKYTNLIRESINLRMEFWRELLQKIPDIIKLQNLGSHITNQVQEADGLF